MSTCTLTNSSGTVLSNALSSAGLSETINAKTVFTLSCADSSGKIYASSATVNIVPTYQEI